MKNFDSKSSKFEMKKKYSNKIDSVEMPNDEHQVGFGNGYGRFQTFLLKKFSRIKLETNRCFLKARFSVCWKKKVKIMNFW